MANRYVTKHRGKATSKVLEAIRNYEEERGEYAESNQQNLLGKAFVETETIEEIMEKETKEGWMLEQGRESKEEEEDEDEKWERIIEWKLGRIWKEQEENTDGETLIREIKRKMGHDNVDHIVEIYTDGSKRQNARANGVGIVIKRSATDPWQERGISISNKATIYTTGAVAIEYAIEMTKEEMLMKDVIIFTDSMSVLQSIRSIGGEIGRGSRDRGSSKRIKKIKETLLEREKQNRREERRSDGRKIGKLQIAWIPAHSGIEGNEKADIRAKEQTEEEPEIEIKIPWEDIKVYLEERMWEKSKEKMREIGRVKGVKYFARRNNNLGRREPWFKSMENWGRKEINTLSRIRANHYNLAESLHRKGMVESPECECGGGAEDINHVIWSCDKYVEERRRLQVELERKGVEEGEDIADQIREDRMGIARKREI